MRISDWSSDVCSSDLNYTPETITDIEAGLKANGQIAGMPYRFAIDGYRGWYKGIQRNYTLPPNFDGDANPGNDPGTGLVVNSGAAILQGVEFDGLIQPVRDLSISISGAYTDAYYTKLQVSPVLDRQSTRLNSSHYCASRMPSSSCIK